MDDLFELIQSRTFIYQLGYGLIKIFVVNIFAELRPLFRQMELSASQDVHATGQQRTALTSNVVCSSGVFIWCIAASCRSFSYYGHNMASQVMTQSYTCITVATPKVK